MKKSTPNAAFFICVQTGLVTPKAEGIPGVAKTKTIEAFARATGRRIYTLIGSIREPADIGGYPYREEIRSDVEIIDPYTGQRVTVFMRLVPPKWAVDCWNGDGAGWILFIDELTTCPPAVQAALLRVIAEKVVGDTPSQGVCF